MSNQHTSNTVKEQVYQWLHKHHNQVEALGTRKAAEYLQEHTEIDATFSTIRTYIQKYRSNNDVYVDTVSSSTSNTPSEKEFADDSPFLRDYIDRENVYYNDQDDVYIVWFNGEAHPIEGDDYRAVKQAYSNWDGDEDTIPEVARKFGFSDSEFRKFKTACGWTHDSSPFSKEEIAAGETKDGETFQENLLRRREQKIYREWQKAEWNETKKEAQCWRNFKRSTIEPLLEGMEQAPTTRTPATPSVPSDTDMAAMFFETDRHLNKQTADGGGFEGNRQAWWRCIDRLIEKITTFQHPEQSFLVLGSDLFHVDTFDGTTSAGTPQRSDLPQRAAVRKTAEAACEVIERIRDISPKTIVRVLYGNHDRRTCLVFRWGLAQRYRHVDDVEVRGDGEPYQYETYGNSLIGWHHGDGTSKQSDLAEKMMTDVPELIGKTKYRYWYTGHKHHIASDEGATLQEMAPTSTKQGSWEDRNGYPEHHRASAAWMFSQTQGQLCRFFGSI